tara:strand:+ start:268 stop:1152 length:885 start_codon:yes stop_codon:yes gene_type:complete
MIEIKGIYAASVSILNENLTLNVEKTINHAENLIKQGCHGVVIFGSTGQAQLISMSEKIQLINKLIESKYKNSFIIGTGLNSLGDTINLVNISRSLGFKKYLIMPPAYYKYKDPDVINFYTEIIQKTDDCKIILYNFEKLCGYKFTISCVEKLVKKFPDQIIGLKDSSYNLYENLKIKNFSILPGSENKLLKGLELGCSGVISATCNVTANLARNVFENFQNGNKQVWNEKLCKVRNIFENYNLISSVHSFLSENDNDYKNLLPPLSLLDDNNKLELINKLNKIDFKIESTKVI